MYVCMCNTHVQFLCHVQYMAVTHVQSLRRCLITYDQSCRYLLTTMWVLGTEYAMSHLSSPSSSYLLRLAFSLNLAS